MITINIAVDIFKNAKRIRHSNLNVKFHNLLTLYLKFYLKKFFQYLFQFPKTKLCNKYKFFIQIFSRCSKFNGKQRINYIFILIEKCIGKQKILKNYNYLWYKCTLFHMCCCGRIEDNCPHLGPGPMKLEPSAGVFLWDPSPYLGVFRRKPRKTSNGQVDKRDRIKLFEMNEILEGLNFKTKI